MGEVTVSERKHRFVIVFVKYYCSDFILTIVFFCFVFCWFLPWLGFESVCFFACCCLNVMQVFLLSVLYNFICCVCVFVFVSACCDRVCVCVLFLFLMKRNIVSFILNFIFCV